MRSIQEKHTLHHRPFLVLPIEAMGYALLPLASLPYEIDHTNLQKGEVLWIQLA